MSETLIPVEFRSARVSYDINEKTYYATIDINNKTILFKAVVKNE